MASCFFAASRRPVLRVTASIYRVAQVSSSSLLNTMTMAPPRSSKGKRSIPEPRPSASVILVSPTNQILLLHRVKTSTSFASAHVFPGGNLDALHDGDVPPPTQPEERHRDSVEYRLAALRECFEESGILLAKEGGDGSGAGGYVCVAEGEREAARRRVHNHEEKFTDWVASVGGVPDVDGLIPFTRWITPPGPPKRFTTQMYLYFLPPKSSSTPLPASAPVPATDATLTVPTPDNGVEHTAATFATASTWLRRHRDREISMFPPQYFLLTLVSRFLRGGDGGANVLAERRGLLEFLQKVPTCDSEAGRAQPTAMIPWADKVISPTVLMARGDGSVALGLDKPGRELEEAGSERGGDFEKVVVVEFGKGDGPWCLGVRTRDEVLREAREEMQEEESEARVEKL